MHLFFLSSAQSHFFSAPNNCFFFYDWRISFASASSYHSFFSPHRGAAWMKVKHNEVI